MSRILAFAGSTRRDSFNKKLARLAADAARQAGAAVTFVDLHEFPMPLYDGDLEAEQGRPESAAKLYEIMKEHEGLLLACPEYNSSITGVLKNTIDWVSRPVDGEPRLAAFRGKVAALFSASPGQLGGLRGLVHVRAILGNIGVIVLPDQVAIPRAQDAFNADGSLTDKRMAAKVTSLATDLVETTDRLAS